MLHKCKNWLMISCPYCLDYVMGVPRDWVDYFLKIAFCDLTWIMHPMIVPSKSFSFSRLSCIVTLFSVPIYLLNLQVIFMIHVDTWNLLFHNEIFGWLCAWNPTVFCSYKCEWWCWCDVLCVPSPDICNGTFLGFGASIQAQTYIKETPKICHH